MLLMLCRTAFTAASPALIEDPSLGLTTADIGAIVGYAAIGSFVGKLLTGFVADHLGGRLTLLLAVVGTALATLAMGFSSSYAAFALFFFSLMVVRAAGWPALAKLIGVWIAVERYGRTWAIMSTASRVSVVISSWVLGAILLYFTWSYVFFSAGIFAILAVVLLSRLFPRERQAGLAEELTRSAPDTGEAADTSEPHDILTTLLGFARSGRFWLICASIMCTTLLTGLLDFMPIYLRASYGVSIPKAAIATSVFPFGCLIAVLAAGMFYDRLTRLQRVYVIGGSLIVACLCIAGMALVTDAAFDADIRFTIALVLVLLLGVCVAPAYYLPMSIFSVEFGGKRSGVLVGFIDATGYAAAAAFGFIGGAIADRPGGWVVFMWVLFGIAIGALVSTSWFLYRDHRVHQDLAMAHPKPSATPTRS
jgi:sugar phosphate permease